MSDAALAALAGLPRLPASDVKRRGWRGIVRALLANGPVVVTNHSEPQAVIVPPDEYARLVALDEAQKAKMEAALVALRQEWDKRLAVLQEPGANERLDALWKKPMKLRGRVKAGESH